MKSSHVVKIVEERPRRTSELVKSKSSFPAKFILEKTKAEVQLLQGMPEAVELYLYVHLGNEATKPVYIVPHIDAYGHGYVYAQRLQLEGCTLEPLNRISK